MSSSHKPIFGFDSQRRAPPLISPRDMSRSQAAAAANANIQLGASTTHSNQSQHVQHTYLTVPNATATAAATTATAQSTLKPQNNPQIRTIQPNAKAPQSSIPTTSQPLPANGIGRTANLSFPSMVKKVELNILGLDNNQGPFSGYNNTIAVPSQKSQQNSQQDSNSMNAQQATSILPIVKELVQAEMNERYKSLLDKNARLEEALRQSNARMQRMESSFSMSLQEANESFLDSSMMSQSSQQNQQGLQDLSQQFTSVKAHIDQLQEKFNGEIQQQIMQAMVEKHSKVQRIVEEQQQTYERKLGILEQQVKIFANAASASAESSGEGQANLQQNEEEEIKRLIDEQSSLTEELSNVKNLLKSVQEEKMQALKQQLDEKVGSFVSQLDQIKASVNSIRSEVNESSMSRVEEASNAQQWKIIEELQSTVRMLQEDKKKQQQQMSLSRVGSKPLSAEEVNASLKEKLAKYQRETSSSIEEMRRLILSNPQIMQEATRAGFRKHSDELDYANQKQQQQQQQQHLHEQHDFSERRDPNEEIEIATFGSTGDSKIFQSFGGGNCDINAISYKVTNNFENNNQNQFINDTDSEYSEMQRMISFGRPEFAVETNEDWHSKYKDHESSVEEIIKKYEEMSQYNSTQQQQSDQQYLYSTPATSVAASNDQVSSGTNSDQQANPKTKQYSHEMPEMRIVRELLGRQSSVVDDMHVSYKGAASELEFKDDNDDLASNESFRMNWKKTESIRDNQVGKNPDQAKNNERAFEYTQMNSIVELGSQQTAHDNILNNLGFQQTMSSSNAAAVKQNPIMFRSFNEHESGLVEVSVFHEQEIEQMEASQQAQILASRSMKRLPSVIQAETQEEEGETIVFDRKTKTFNVIKSTNSSKSISNSGTSDAQSAGLIGQLAESKDTQLFEVSVHNPVEDYIEKHSEATQISNSQTLIQSNFLSVEPAGQQASNSGVAAPNSNSPSPLLSESFSILHASQRVKQRDINDDDDDAPDGESDSSENDDMSKCKILEVPDAIQDTYSPAADVAAPIQASQEQKEYIPTITVTSTINESETNERIGQLIDNQILNQNATEQGINRVSTEIIEIQGGSQKKEQLAESQDSSNILQNKEEIIEEQKSDGNNQEKSNQQLESNSNNNNGQEEEDEIVYQLDENGYLMDENGNYILGDDGEMVKLSNEDIQYLAQTNMLEES